MLAFLIGFAVGGIAGLVIAISLKRRRERAVMLDDIPDFLRIPRVGSPAGSSTSTSGDLDWVEIHPLPKRVLGNHREGGCTGRPAGPAGEHS